MACLKVLVVIPARLDSERLPRKPLIDLGGRSLIVRVWERVSALAGVDRVLIAADSEEVAAECRRVGADVELTDPALTSGTHRVAAAVRQRAASVECVVNVQGDEPFVGEDAVSEAVRAVRSGWDVGTVGTPVRTVDAWRDPAVVKVVRDDNGRALYFSRAPIPHPRDRAPTPDELSGEGYLRHVGVYAYQPEALQRWVELPPAPLEAIERLEQLRPLAAGMAIGVGLVVDAARGIDTEADVRWARGRLRGGERVAG
ncbi:MAG: 3-deoxy-manno-octulosonate cytidylyltransferase [Gemmatimonadota bacterium]